MKKRIVSILIVFALAISMVCTNAFVVNTKAVSSEKKIEEMVEGVKDSVRDYHKTHIIKDDGSRIVINPKYKNKKRKGKSSIPNAYMSPYTSIKDQNAFGSCWMFAEMASLESNLLNKAGYSNGLVSTDPIDLSEAQGVYVQLNKRTVNGTINGAAASDSDNDVEVSHDDNYYGYDEGGWPLDASMSVSADKGAALENDNRYISTSYDQDIKAEESLAMATTAAGQYKLNRFNIKSADQLPNVFSVEEDEESGEHTRVYNPENRDIWKEKIIQNGAISCNYMQTTSNKYHHAWGRDIESYNYPPDFWRYDANEKGIWSTNHVVTIVGFDDDYSKYHFAAKYNSHSYDSLVARRIYIKT